MAIGVDEGAGGGGLGAEEGEFAGGGVGGEEAFAVGEEDGVDD